MTRATTLGCDGQRRPSDAALFTGPKSARSSPPRARVTTHSDTARNQLFSFRAAQMAHCYEIASARVLHSVQSKRFQRNEGTLSPLANTSKPNETWNSNFIDGKAICIP